MEPYKFPLPPTAQDFEALIKQLSEDRHPDAVVQKFGRNGQSQHGVDVLVTRKDGTFDGYQCKHVKSLGAATVLAEVAKAATFPHELSQFIIYSTAPRNKDAQSAAAEAARVHPFLVRVSSWDDIAVDLMNNLRVSQQYMAQLPLHSMSNEYMRQLRIAFDRPAFIHPSQWELSHGEQLQAVKDVEEFLSTGWLRTRGSAFVLSSLPASSVPGLRPHMSKVRKLIGALRGTVTPAAKAEQRGDLGEVMRLREGIDAARVALMHGVNTVLEANGTDAIAFAPDW